MEQDACWENVRRLPGLSLCVQRKFCLYPGVRAFVVRLVDSVCHFLQKFNLEEYCKRQTFWWLLTSTSHLELSESQKASLKTCFLYSLFPYYHYLLILFRPMTNVEATSSFLARDKYFKLFNKHVLFYHFATEPLTKV